MRKHDALLGTLAMFLGGVGCTTKIVGDLEGGSEGGSDSDGSTSSLSGHEGGSVSATGGSATSGASDSATGGGSETSALTTGQDCPNSASSCDPQRVLETADTAWMIDGGAFVGEDRAELVDCIVEDLLPSRDKSALDLVLACTSADSEMMDTTRVLTLPARYDWLATLLPGGMAVRLEVVIQLPFWEERYFALSDTEGNLLLGGIDSSALRPSAPVTPVNQFFGGIQLAVNSGVCEPECAFDPGECGIPHRFGIYVSLDDGEMTVVDGNSAIAGFGGTNYELAVGTAAGLIEFEDHSCADVPGEWYTVLLVQTSSAI